MAGIKAKPKEFGRHAEYATNWPQQSPETPASFVLHLPVSH
jgi:hypothetical protein